MSKKIILAASITLLAAISGQALAYSNVAPKAPHEAVSNERMSNAFDAFDHMTTRWRTEPDNYRYHGGPQSDD